MVFVSTGVVFPPKPLLKVPRFIEYIKHAKDYGIEASGTPNFEAVIKRSRGVADKMSKRRSVPDEEKQDRCDQWALEN